MTKLVVDAMMDAALDYLKNNVTELYVCSGDPADRAACVTNALATKTGLTSGNWTGPANGDTSGRKITKDAETAIDIDVSGTALHIGLCSATTLILKTSVPSQALSDTGTVDVNAFDDEIADAA